jgi:hypothetical protein
MVMLGCGHALEGATKGGINDRQPSDVRGSRRALLTGFASPRIDPHPDRADSLHDVAVALTLCYEETGNKNLLSEAISHLRETVTLRPAPHPERRIA